MLRYFWFRSKFFLRAYQQVGYKNNEFWAWIKANWDGKVIPVELGIFNLFVFLLILPEDWFPVWPTDSTIALILFSYALFWLTPVTRYKPEKVKKPLVVTNRMKRLLIPFGFATLFLPVFFSYAAYSPVIRLISAQTSFLSFDVILLVFGWVFGAIMIPFFVLFAGALTKPIENRIQEGFKKQAHKKLASMPQLKVVAITGSYGKTSTKFMIRDLLKERYSVCTTPGSYNTPMGICKVINNDLQSHHQILILEMGARYPGNIKELCDIATPDVSVVSNVGFAHLETFGSQDIIAREKGVIVDTLKPAGVAVLNADDPRVSKMGQDRTDITKVLVGLENGEIRANDISYNNSGSEFKVQIENETEAFQSKLLGAHNVQNILLAVGVAHHFGIRAKTMALAAKSIEPVEHRLELKKMGDLTIIDDAFNSNPVGAKNAVEILSQFKSGRRIIITPGMVELGEIEEEENRNFGEAIGKAHLDKIILVGRERSKPILEGILKAEGQEEKVSVVDTLFEANDILKEYTTPGDVVLYENDLPDVYNE